MLKESGIGSGWDDDMKANDWLNVFLLVVILMLAAACFMAGKKYAIKNNPELQKLQIQEKELSIKVLQHELKAYEEMDKELAE